MSDNITINTILEELSRVLSQPDMGDEGATTEEISAATGWSKTTTRINLRLLGSRLAVGKRRMIRIDGKPSFSPCYRLHGSPPGTLPVRIP